MVNTCVRSHECTHKHVCVFTFEFFWSVWEDFFIHTVCMSPLFCNVLLSEKRIELLLRKGLRVSSDRCTKNRTNVIVKREQTPVFTCN